MKKENDSGSFTTGFMLGIVAGAVGFFAFGTSRGKGLRKRLEQEWEEAQESWRLSQPVSLEKNQVSNIYSEFKHYLQNALGSFDSLAQTQDEQEQKNKRRKKRVSQKGKFKGL